MKKRKLLATIFGGCTVLAATPIIATACNENKSEKDKKESISASVQWLSWSDTPANGINSILRAITVKKPNGDLIDFTETPIKSMEYNGSASGLNVKPYDAGNWQSISITPDSIGKYSLKIKITAYKDILRKEEGETYYVDEIVDVVTSIKLLIEPLGGANITSYNRETSLMTVTDKTAVTKFFLVTSPTPINDNYRSYGIWGGSLWWNPWTMIQISDDIIEVDIQANRITTTPTKVTIGFIAWEQSFQPITFYIKSAS